MKPIKGLSRLERLLRSANHELQHTEGDGRWALARIDEYEKKIAELKSTDNTISETRAK